MGGQNYPYSKKCVTGTSFMYIAGYKVVSNNEIFCGK